MSHSDFTAARTARVDQLSATSVAWANPEKRPLKAAIRSGNNTRNGIATGGRATDTALDLADAKAGKALDSASSNTGSGLAKALRAVSKALAATMRKTGDALGVH